MFFQVVVGILWLFFSMACVGIYPLWEGRKSLAHTFRSMWRDVTGKEHPKKFQADAQFTDAHEIEKSDGAESPPGKGVDTPPVKEEIGEKETAIVQ
jgi:hypothetical protein